MEHAQQNGLTVLIHLLHLAREAQNPIRLGFIMVNESRQLLVYRQAAFWQEGLLRQVVSVSGLAEPDVTSPYLQWLAAVFRFLHKQYPDLPPYAALTAASLPAHLAADWEQWLPPYAIWFPLGSAGALLFASEQLWDADTLQYAQELTHGYRFALTQHLPQQNRRQKLQAWLKASPQRKWWLLAPLVVLCVPVRMSVLARAEVVPSDPVLIRAPVAGVIDKVMVRPNQAIQKGTTLFALDATVLAGQFALAKQEALAAKERFRISAQMAVTSDKNKLELAEDKSRLAAKDISADYAGRALDKLNVTAPGNGVVVFSDVDEWQGKAVNVGEKVMTLADPAHVELAAWLPAADAIHLSPGAKVTLYPNASPFSAFDATLVRMAYKAEVSDGNVLTYRLLATFLPTNHPPMLGQMGTARIYGNWVPLGYYALRRPLTAARQWLGW
jgi:Membrane-fusion protein